MVIRIDLLKLLYTIEDYVLIKISDDFPDYIPESDIDLVVFDRKETLNKLLIYYNKLVGEHWELRVLDDKEHCHVDFILCRELNIRIDLIDNFNHFEKLSVRNTFLHKLFKDRKQLNIGRSKVYVPSEEDNLTLRYFEYLEYFYKRPEKIKHYEYICNVKDEELKQKFFDNTHRFINFKRKIWDESSKETNFNLNMPKSRREAIKIISCSIHYLINATFKKCCGHVRKWL